MGGSLNLEDSADADHEEGYRFLNLELDGPGMGDGIFVYNDLKDVLICNVEITGYATAINLEGSNKPAAGSDGKNARVMVRGSRLHDNTAFGFLGACDGCGVEYSYFDHNGQNNEFDHNIYFSGIADGNGVDYVAKGMRAVGNELYHAAQGPGTVCEGTALVVHGQHDGLLIQGNRIIHELGQSAAGCWGIGVVPGYGGRAEGFTNVTIVGNTVVNVGNESIYAVGLLLGSQPVLEPDEPERPVGERRRQPRRVAGEVGARPALDRGRPEVHEGRRLELRLHGRRGLASPRRGRPDARREDRHRRQHPPRRARHRRVSALSASRARAGRGASPRPGPG